MLVPRLCLPASTPGLALALSSSLLGYLIHHFGFVMKLFCSPSRARAAYVPGFAHRVMSCLRICSGSPLPGLKSWLFTLDSSPMDLALSIQSPLPTCLQPSGKGFSQPLPYEHPTLPPAIPSHLSMEPFETYQAQTMNFLQLIQPHNPLTPPLSSA